MTITVMTVSLHLWSCDLTSMTSFWPTFFSLLKSDSWSPQPPLNEKRSFPGYLSHLFSKISSLHSMHSIFLFFFFLHQNLSKQPVVHQRWAVCKRSIREWVNPNQGSTTMEGEEGENPAKISPENVSFVKSKQVNFVENMLTYKYVKI